METLSIVNQKRTTKTNKITEHDRRNQYLAINYEYNSSRHNTIQEAMHPPLDRPHPECQDEINGLRDCHRSASKLKFWACNEVKDAVDKCFRDEKKKMLKEMNINLEEKRQEEYSQAALAFNKKGVTFRESLTTDPIYQKELENERKRQNSWFSKIF